MVPPKPVSALRRISSALTTFEGLPQAPSAGYTSPLSSSDGSFSPHSVFLSLWHQLLLCALCYELFIIPFLLTFKPRANLLHTPEAIVFYACESLFLLDFYFKLNTLSIKDGNSQGISISRRTYLRSVEFALDTIAIIPLSVFPFDLSGSSMLLELTKVVRVARLPRYLANLDNLYAKHFAALKLFKILVGVVLLSHGIACIRFSFGYHSDVADPHHQDHWLPRHSPRDHSTPIHYLRALFWAFGMLTGLYEGELPRTSLQFVFTIFVAVCGFSMFTYLCATFFMLSKCESSQYEVSEARINQLKQVLRFHDAPQVLQHKVVNYLRYYYEDAGSSDRQVMEILCQSIGRDIQVELMKDVFTRVPLFAACSDQFLVAITRLLERISFPAQAVVFTAGDTGDAMYLIHTGVLDVLSRSGKKLRELRKNDLVGELSLFTDQTRSATVTTATFCVLFKLSRRHAEIVLKGYPGVASTIKLYIQRTLAASTTKAGNGSEPGTASMPRRSSMFNTSLQQLMRQGDSLRGSLFKRSGSTASVTPVLPNSLGGEAEQVGDSLVPRHDRTSTSLSHQANDLTGSKRKGSDAMRAFYWEYLKSGANASKQPWWTKLLLQSCIDAASPRRLWWIAGLQLVLVYNWFQIPLNLAFPLFVHSAWYVAVLNAASDVVLWVDIYVNLNLSYTLNSETIWDPRRSATRYFKGGFCFDLLTSLPVSGFSDSTFTYIGRIPRLFRIWRSMDHYHEVDQLRPLKGKGRLLVYGVLLGFLSHILACLYFSLTFIEGFNVEEDSWLPSHDVQLRDIGDDRYIDYRNVTFAKSDPEVRRIAFTQYFRALYYATNVLTALGRTIEPKSGIQFAVALVFQYGAFFITAIVVDNVQKRFTASAIEEKEFFATRSRIQRFLRHQKAPFAIHQRANNYLDYWWESHRGAKINELLSDLPTDYRREVLLHICKPALQTLALLSGVRLFLDDIEVAVVDNAEFVLYGEGETIYGEGEHSHGLFFLLDGSVRLHCTNQAPRDVIRGGWFGSKSFYADGGGSGAAGYTENAVAESGCTVLFLPRRKLVVLERIFPSLGPALANLEKRLLDSKLSMKRKSATTRHSGGSASRWSWLTSSIDPDSKFVVVWETWLFVMMSFQWFRVIVLIGFGIDPEHHSREDALMVVAELSFAVDVYLRLRLGFRRFGNKVMEPKLIRRRYLRSFHFIVDVVAILPLYVINWASPSLRMEVVNLNKLVRLVKVPSQLHALEKRYAKFTNELRLFKLVYYTSVASHLLGSLYFDFASHASAIYSIALGDAPSTNFGGNKWLPPASLENVTIAEQYFASQFWAFGLMSASTQAELPKTTVQCIFTIATLTTGFFLFAYVVGNLADVIELGGAESREINEKLGRTRRLLQHFSLPHALATNLQAYFLFKRFHSITQEHILAQSLPPSLMTDIRLLNLRAMIDKVPFLSGMEGSITRMLVAQFTQRLVLKDEYVFRAGDTGTDMFFVFSGFLEVLHALEAVFELYPSWRKRVEQTAKVQQKQHRLPTTGASHPRKRSVPSAVVPVGTAAAPSLDPRWSRARTSRGRIELQSAEYIAWMRVALAATLAIAVSVPYCIAFDSCGRWTGRMAAIDALEVCCFVVFTLDVWIHWRLKQSKQSAEFCEGDALDSYKRQRLVWDVLALLPLEYLATLITGSADYGWLRLSRCFKLANLVHYMDEISRTSVSFESAQLQAVCSSFVLVIHWVACLYLLFAERMGYADNWNAWMPSHEIVLTDSSSSVFALRYLRGLFFAATAFLKKCRTFTPETTSANIFAILTWFTGLLVMAFVIGEIASLYISFIRHEVVFRKHYIATERSLADWKLSPPLKARVHAFLANLWSSHRGLHYQAVLDELPSNLRQEAMIKIGDAALSTFKTRILQPLAVNKASRRAECFRAVVDKLRFESYPPGEFVITEGAVPSGLFFVVKGRLAGSIRQGRHLLPLSPIKQGSSFGELGVLSFSMSKMSVQTVEASDLLSLSLDSLQDILSPFPVFVGIERVTNRLAHDLRAESNGSLPTERAAWARRLELSLQAERERLALQVSDVGGQDNDRDDWNRFLASLLDVVEPAEACLRVFEPFLEMLLPQGDVFWAQTQPAWKKTDQGRPEQRAITRSRVLSASRKMRALGKSSSRVCDLVVRMPSVSSRLGKRSSPKKEKTDKPARVTELTPVEAFSSQGRDDSCK